MLKTLHFPGSFSDAVREAAKELIVRNQEKVYLPYPFSGFYIIKSISENIKVFRSYLTSDLGIVEFEEQEVYIISEKA